MNRSNHTKQALILIRGLPGSGKSTLAAELSESGKYPVYSTDHYFIHTETNEYVFEFDKNHLAYKQCEELTEASMQQHCTKIFVDNTFTLEWEMEPYFKLAAEYSYQVFVITVENRHGGRNIHNISNEQLEKMAAKFKVQLM